MAEKKAEKRIAVPEGVEVKIEKGIVTTKGPKGECRKSMVDPWIEIKVEGKEVIFNPKKQTKREKTRIWTYVSHLQNMLKGASEGHAYRMKICSGHFPMNVSVSGNEFVVNNFLGEKKPRTLKIKEGATVNVEGDIVVVESPCKETAGQTAADIESLTKVRNRDLRIFQDGIYITEKDGKPVR
jgi:large subunit ribosomal protein L6